MADPLIGMTFSFDPAPVQDDAPRGGLGSQVLPVAELDDDFEGEPGDGMEYLFLVRREASTHPSINRVPNPYQAPDETEEELLARAAPREVPSNRPDESWRIAYLKQFEALRERMEAAPPLDTFPRPTHDPLPPLRDCNAWKTFINGKRVRRAAPPPPPPSEPTLAEAKAALLASLSLDEPSSDTATAPTAAPPPTLDEPEAPPQGDEEYSHLPHLPTPYLLLSLDQHTSITVLGHISDWLVERIEEYEQVKSYVPSTIFAPPSLRHRKKGQAAAPPPAAPPKPTTPLPPLPLPTPHESQWILSLLLRLDSLLTGEDISTLRTLVKTILEVLNLPEEEDERRGKGGLGLNGERGGKEVIAEEKAMAWMIVAAVTEVWGQKDLWNENV
ncbi:hypothetical protein MNV49_005590 [Pseudohyphozyma bogoriensis]|nr:hypothetical protein MNV49_005590 [Pseudohyphozyma bogoriensis]